MIFGRSARASRRVVVLVMLFASCAAPPATQLAATTPLPELPARSVVHSPDQRDQMLITALHTYITAIMRARDVPGFNIALARRGRMVWEGAYGYADARSRRPTTTETVFHSGSIGKAFAAVAIMQLVEQGRLQLDDPISTLLPFVLANPLGGPAITTRHLLTHTSGIGRDEIDSYMCEELGSVLPLEDRVREAYAQPGRFTAPTGAAYSYSNLGLGTLGLIVERTNPERLSYADYVQKKILDPLQMEFAQFPRAQMPELVRPEVWSRTSTGYSRMGGVWLPAVQLCFGLYPCGGLLATPSDYLRMLIALMNRGTFNDVRILSAESVAAILTPQPLPDSSTTDARLTMLFGKNGSSASLDQGLIFVLENWGGPHRSFQHTGGHFWGWQTRVAAYPNTQTAFVSAENQWDHLWPYNRETVHGRVHAFIDAWIHEESTRDARDFAEELLRARLTELRSFGDPHTSVPTVSDIAWKLSYLRGLLYTNSYQAIARSRDQRLSEAQARLVATGADTSLSAVEPAFWNSQAFVVGAMDMAAVAPHPDSVRAFALSGRMRVSLEEANQLYPLLNPPTRARDGIPTPGALGGLLTMPSESGRPR